MMNRVFPFQLFPFNQILKLEKICIAFPPHYGDSSNTQKTIIINWARSYCFGSPHFLVFQRCVYFCLFSVTLISCCPIVRCNDLRDLRFKLAEEVPKGENMSLQSLCFQHQHGRFTCHRDFHLYCTVFSYYIYGHTNRL